MKVGGRLVTVPEGFPPGSEVANTAILGYDLNKVYEGRGPLEAASIGYEMTDDDFAIRCNIITLEDGKIITHNGGNLETDDARNLIDYLNEHLAKPINNREGCERVTIPTKSGAPCWCNQIVWSAIQSQTPTVSLPSKRPTC